MMLFDWPELRPAADRLWQLAAEELRAAGVDAPAALDRTTDFKAAPLSPDLLVAQACGLAYVRHLAGRVRMVGSFVHDLPEVPPGCYVSAVVVARDHPAQTLDDLRGARLAANEPDSWSGVGVWRRLLAGRRDGDRFFGGIDWTGGHRASLAAVASGQADVTAVDGVYWHIAHRHIPEAEGLRLLLQTEPDPAPPLVTAPDGPREALIDAMTSAIGRLDAQSRRDLCLTGFRRRSAEDFAAMADWDRKARPIGCEAL